jgi:ribosomal protein S18 acetylase RimI-like enzyme
MGMSASGCVRYSNTPGGPLAPGLSEARPKLRIGADSREARRPTLSASQIRNRKAAMSLAHRPDTATPPAWLSPRRTPGLYAVCARAPRITPLPEQGDVLVAQLCEVPEVPCNGILAPAVPRLGDWPRLEAIWEAHCRPHGAHFQVSWEVPANRPSAVAELPGHRSSMLWENWVMTMNPGAAQWTAPAPRPSHDVRWLMPSLDRDAFLRLMQEGDREEGADDARVALFGAHRLRAWQDGPRWFIGVFEGGILHASASAHRFGAFWYIEDVYVRASARRRGHARAMLTRLLSDLHADDPGTPVLLRVDPRNPVLALYEALGFVRASSVWSVIG